MLQTIRSLLLPAVQQRLTLLVNHLLMAEPTAMQRLKAHEGKRLHVEFTDWPALLPAPPAAAFRVTPAGLFEWCDDAAPGTESSVLTLRVAAPNPALLMARLAAGERPAVDVQGEAPFAADVHWLAESLRWDMEGDLSRMVGPLAARQIASLGAALAAGMRRWVPK